MSGLLTTFYTSVSGLQTAQMGTSTASHNIANANTEGYSRQRVNLTNATPRHLGSVGFMGMGVQATSITRMRNEFLDGQYRYENSIYGESVTENQTLEQMELIYHEPGEFGLNKQMYNYLGLTQFH